MPNTKVVINGCGGMSNTWIKTAQTIEGLEIAGLVDVAEAAAQGKREQYGLADTRVYTQLEQALSELKPDLVFDVSIPEAHTETAITAFRHGCHVLAEKPLADSMDNARRTLAAARAAGRQYAVMQNRRYLRPARRVQRFVESGAIGPLTMINVDFFIGAHFGGFRDEMKHVLLLDMAIHTFDALRYVSGADAVAVYCKEFNPAGSWYAHGASAVAVFEMSNGAVATYRGSWCSEGLPTKWESDWRLIGTRGSALWDGGEGFRAEAAQPGSSGFLRPVDALTLPEFDTSQVENGHDSCIREFVHCVRTGTQPLTHAGDNAKSLAMVFGAIESAGTGERVIINTKSAYPEV
jgi:predicted dehydrogenase